MTMYIRAMISAALIGALGSAASAQEQTNRVAGESDWGAFEGNDPRECWAATAPKESVNTRDGSVVQVRRGDIILFVNFRPSENIVAEVSFTGGYPFAEGSSATLQIGDTTFSMITEGEYAWPATPAEDQKVVAALKRGSEAVITARSSRGTQTKDTFSLLGATAMIENAEALCAQ